MPQEDRLEACDGAVRQCLIHVLLCIQLTPAALAPGGVGSPFGHELRLLVPFLGEANWPVDAVEVVEKEGAA